jgi:hypothetical protein
VNYNYYDNPILKKQVNNFIINSIRKQLEFNIRKDVCICLGSGKNYKFLTEINNKYHFFTNIIALEHPRYIMQYKSKKKEAYIEKYIATLKNLI